jgi:capsular exopolysaccharide synthesis family protein
MTRVFEALQREQERRKKESSRDPLAAETGAPEDGPRTESEAAAAEYELPSVIGAPVSPRSNDGMPQLIAGQPVGPQKGISTPTSSAGLVAEAGGANDPSNMPAGIPAVAEVGVKGRSLNGPAKESSRSGIHDDGAATANGANTHPSIARDATGDAASGVAASRVVDDIRRRQTETQRLREELSLQGMARTAREIPIERLSLSGLHQRLILLTQPAAPECEQYRTLRTQLFHAAEKRQTQVVVITSALAGEGKTSTALNLSIAVAQSKESRILIIDGDLRRPNIGSYLGLRPKVGLGEVLKGDAAPLDAIVCLDEPELYILPISREAANPTELLSSERFVDAIRELRDYFDFILIDSPPVMPFADTRLLSNHADAVILVVRAEKAPSETVEKVVEVLPSGRILGVVLNDARYIRETGYYDYYYNYTQREQRRGALLGRLSSRVRDSWLGKKMKW